MTVLEFIENFLTGTALVSIPEAVNMGREDAYDELGDVIPVLQWSAILDKKTCPICRELDGKYFYKDDPLLDYIKPPIHLGCRCILVGVFLEELENYPVKVERLDLDSVKRWTKNKFWMRI